MTKRAIKKHGPIGFNKNLGSSISTEETNKKRKKKLKKASAETTDADSKTGQRDLISKTEESDLQQFFADANLAQIDFKAQRSDVEIITKASQLPANSADSLFSNKNLIEHVITLPRRPDTYFSGSVEELERLECEAFYSWKKSIAKITENNNIVLTPYEKNLEVWRQLWRVIERSDIIVQIVDSRNPLQFYNPDLDIYVREISPLKKNLLLINKCDLLTREQINEWKRYFKEKNIEAIFWSNLENRSKNNVSLLDENQLEKLSMDDNISETLYINSPEDLIDIFHKNARYPSDNIVVGMIGYPNVGKSSTLNRIFGAKKVSVSMTPGKTKHFQTLIFDDKLTLCDCPGLVMPSFSTSKAEMVLNGILPTNHCHDLFSPVQLICNRVSRHVLEKTYSILLPKPIEGNRPPTANEFLTVVSFSKGYMAPFGLPDCSKAAKMVLNDTLKGVIKLATAPPDFPQDKFDEWIYLPLLHNHGEENIDKIRSKQHYLDEIERRNLLPNSMPKILETEFFIKNGDRAHILSTKQTKIDSKKHHNKNKREKLRRVYGDNDI